MLSTPRTRGSGSVIGRRLTPRVRRLVIRREAVSRRALGGDWPQRAKPAGTLPWLVEACPTPVLVAWETTAHPREETASTHRRDRTVHWQETINIHSYEYFS